MGVVHGTGRYKDDVRHCDQCPAKYASEAKLKEHIMSKHMGVKFPCEHCGKQFRQKNTVVAHIKSGKCQVLAAAVGGGGGVTVKGETEGSTKDEEDDNDMVGGPEEEEEGEEEMVEESIQEEY